MQGANLDGASLQGASLSHTQLQAGTLRGAQLQGAVLILTQLQGAKLDVAQLHHATLSQVFAWRADIRSADAFTDIERKVVDARVVALTIDAKEYCPGKPDNACDWSAESFARLKSLVPLDKIQDLDKAAKPAIAGEGEMTAAWNKLAGSVPATDLFEKGVTQRLRDTGCAAEGAPYVVRGVIRTAIAFGLSPGELSALAKAFLSKDCGSAYGLTEADRTKLTDIDRTQSLTGP
jgi:pentapeptide repeat protein